MSTEGPAASPAEPLGVDALPLDPAAEDNQQANPASARQESDEPRIRRPSKRKHSPTPSSSAAPSPSPAPGSAPGSAPGAAVNPATPTDPSDVSPPPVLVPHTLQLPPSPFDFYGTRNHPFNKHGYRYTPCGPSLGTPLPVPPQRTIEPNPRGVHWSWHDRSPFTALTEDARTVTTDKGWRAARTDVGLREGSWYWEIKVERGAGEGGRDKGGEGQGSWVRVGVGRRESPLNAPPGANRHSYGYRDKTGDAVTLAQPKPFGKPYGSSTTIGIYLSLPPRPPASAPTDSQQDRRSPARIVRKRIPIRYRGSLYFEQLEYAPSKEMDELLVDPALEAFRKRQQEEKQAKAKKAAPGTKAPPTTLDAGPPLRPLPRLEGSQVAFFVDGECQGVAYEDLYDFLPLPKIRNPHARDRKKDGRALMENWHDDGALGYFPMVSVFGGGIATLNPGPDFEFPPPQGDLDAVLAASPHPPTQPRTKAGAGHWKPLSERYDEFVAEQAYLDDLDAQEAVRVLLEAKREAERAQALQPRPVAEAPPLGANMTPTPDSVLKKARTAGGGGGGGVAPVAPSLSGPSLVQTALNASSRLAALGAVPAEASVLQTESPGASPAPLGAEPRSDRPTENVPQTTTAWLPTE
ncbi:transcription factor, contains a PHD finger motif [Rhodotorula sphaerocarpa]